MASSSELRQLRSEALKRHRAATRKVSRLKSNTGVKVSGSKVDPRTSPGNIRRYTGKQLKSYINKLNSFIDRKVQYVPDARKQPISAQSWKAYKTAEKEYNRQVADRFSKYRDIFDPSSGLTIGERMEMFTPSREYLQDRAVNTPYTPVNRRSTNIGSERAVKRLTEDMQSRIADDAFVKRVGSYKDQFDEMMETLNVPSIAEQVYNLSDEQFDLLWNYTGFANAISLGYEMTKSLLSGNEQPWHSGILRDSVNTANEMAQWAGTVQFGS